MRKELLYFVQHVKYTRFLLGRVGWVIGPCFYYVFFQNSSFHTMKLLCAVFPMTFEIQQIQLSYAARLAQLFFLFCGIVAFDLIEY